MTAQTTIRNDRQQYYDEPIYCHPRPDPIGRAVRQAMRTMDKKPLLLHDGERQPVILRHERVKLRWLVPDGQGGLKPRDK